MARTMSHDHGERLPAPNARHRAAPQVAPASTITPEHERMAANLAAASRAGSVTMAEAATALNRRARLGTYAIRTVQEDTR